MPPEDVVFLLDRLRPSTELRADRRDAATVRPRRRVNAAAWSPSVDHRGRGRGSSPSRWLRRGVQLGLDAACRLQRDDTGCRPSARARSYPHMLTAIDRCRLEGLSGIDAALADQVAQTAIRRDRRTGDTARLGPAGRPRPDRLLDTCRDGWERVVVTTSPLIEDLQRWGDRFGVSRAVLRSADVVVGCCGADATRNVAIPRLDRPTSPRLRQAAVTVLNKVPKAERVAAEVSRQLVDVGGDLVGTTYRDAIRPAGGRGRVGRRRSSAVGRSPRPSPRSRRTRSRPDHRRGLER